MELMDAGLHGGWRGADVSPTLAQLKGLAGSPQKITTDKGELVLSGFDEATGKVSYTYTAKVLPHTGRRGPV